MADRLVLLAALSAAIAIGAGAFGAHGAAPPAVDWLKTGGVYQLTHAIAILSIGPRYRRAGWVLLGGSALFSGTLYLMAAGAPRWLGAITPIGGVLMISGWLLVAASAARRSP
jgi:uncharacterized membrane protein YgdD (TMEM256/DUF423 family)